MSDGPEDAHEITSPGRPRTVEVADGVYAYVQPDGTWWINNTGFVVGPQGVFGIDACSTERRTRASLAAIRHATAASVVFCGALVFNGGTPFLLMGSVAGCIEALEKVVLALGARTVVPGHGPVFEGTAPIEATLDYLGFVLELAAEGRAAGLTPLEVAREADLGRFAGWPDAERLVGNLHRAYAELAGTPRGGPIDVGGALADMVAYNGGKPLTCLALGRLRGL